MKSKPNIWVAWENQRRSKELAAQLGCQLYVYDYRGILRYPKSITKTLFLLLRQKNNIVFVQNPSMVLAALACLVKTITKAILVVDRHTTFRLNKSAELSLEYIVFRMFNRYTLKNADITIVTNEDLASIVIENKGTPFILPDKLPDIAKSHDIILKNDHNIILISSFAEDEPIGAVIEAMKMLKKLNKHDVTLYVSGNYKKLSESVIADVPDNIVFTGYLNDSDFENMLHAVDGIMVLTTAESCMLCGCYEAVSVLKPLITSDKKVLNDYFHGSIFVDNTSAGICGGIIKLIDDYPIYLDNTVKLKNDLCNTWSLSCDKLTHKLSIILNKRINHEEIKK